MKRDENQNVEYKESWHDKCFAGLQGQVCIASRGKVEKLCMEVNAGVSADVSLRALWGSGGLKSP